MAPNLTALERFLERLVERPIGRLFRAPVEPEQLRRRVERAMEEGRRGGATTVAPDRYRILLRPEDLAGLERRDPTIATTLAESAHGYARQRGWQLARRPTVELRPSTALARGDVAVESAFSGREAAEAVDGSVARADPAGGRRAATTLPALEPTAVLPMAAAGELTLVISSRGRPERRVVLAGGVLRIGRAVDNEVVLSDERVSRHHGLITSSHGSLVYRDLASANGSFLRGQRVTEVALGPGDELTLGSTSLRLVRP